MPTNINQYIQMCQFSKNKQKIKYGYVECNNFVRWNLLISIVEMLSVVNIEIVN